MTNNIWIGTRYVTLENFEQQVLQLYSYKEEEKEKVGWYYCPGPLQTLKYDLWNCENFSMTLLRRQVKVYKTQTTKKLIVLINGTTNLYYNLGECMDRLGEYNEVDPLYGMSYDTVLENDLEYYRSACETFKRELSVPYTSYDATGPTRTAVIDTDYCQKCGNQNRSGGCQLERCNNCMEVVDPYGILLVHEECLVDALLTAIEICIPPTITSDDFVRITLPLLRRHTEG